MKPATSLGAEILEASDLGEERGLSPSTHEHMK